MRSVKRAMLLAGAAILAAGPGWAQSTPATPAASPEPAATSTPAAPAAVPGSTAASPPEASKTTPANNTPADPNAKPAGQTTADAPAAPALGTGLATTGAIGEPAARNEIVAAAEKRLGEKPFVSRFDGEDVAALSAFYKGRSEPLWIKDGALTARATATADEIRKADDWGLQASAFDLPALSAGATPEQQGEAEAKLSLAVLKYARAARGGRVEPLSISNIWDMKPPVREPKSVLADIADNAAPGSYLTGLHPKHPQFEKLRQALIKARGPQETEKIDEALLVKLPTASASVKPGQEHDDIAALRKRLKVEAQSSGNERLYDARLEAAVRAFQEDKGIKATGVLDKKTRAALNAEGEPKKRDSKSEVDRIVVNMERWRWLPEDLGKLYVINNIPEYVGRVYKGDEALWEERIIVGQPTWPTPILAAQMQYIVFHPEWGVPDGIKMKELLPRLKQASGGGGFFEELFGGGSSGGGRVLAAYGLKPSINGRPVDPNSINWNKVDIRQFSFVQPAGGQNPLGEVKFRFPNRHDVYMHDTTQRGLFAQSFRALSHGCIRVQNPRKLSEVLLAEDKGWSKDKSNGMYAGGGEVALDKPIPVYLAYFTARVDGEGKLRTYSDIYGHDGRLLSALAGRAVRYNAPEASSPDLVADASDGNYEPAGEPSPRKAKGKKGKEPAAMPRRKGDTTGDILTNAISGVLSNF